CALAAEADLLVANAGRGWAGELSDMPGELVGSLVALNLEAPLRLARAAAAGMRERGGGHLAFVASIAVVGVREEAVYSATKAGLRAFAASLRHELGPHGVGVTTVLPGAVRTEFFRRRGRPYDRTVPRPVAPAVVADALVRAVQRGRAEVFVPGWLGAAARLQGLAPATFHRLAGRFG
ncbi:MAG TPA: SDR family NAD(P)-dependent oxidoreductase, partial [Pseudonocardia sp.]|nr:SDR family NAD(P)-dependent oxidoreductase [Pseudonocardia sp.]